MAPFLTKLTQCIDQLQSQHCALTDRSWLALPSGRTYLPLIILLSLAAAFANFHVRSQQFTYWESHPEKFFVGNTPLFSTMDTGTAIPANGNANGPALSYDLLQCKLMTSPSQLNCNGHVFDLRSGKVDGSLVLDGAVCNHNGLQGGGLGFLGNQLNVLQMAKIDQTQQFYLLHRDLFQSSFNQLFHLGRADSTLFEIVYDDYPHARIFRLQKK